MKTSIHMYLVVLSVLVLAYAAPAWADDDDHKHDKKPSAPQTEASKQHKDNQDHDHGKEQHKEDAGHEHGHDEEEESGEKNVGPNKGVTSFDEDKGFTLSEEAKKTFALQTQMLKGQGPWTLPTSAILLTGEETNIYRVRDDAFKRIDVEVVKKAQGQVQIQSRELRNGDAVVTQGVGFIRIAEADVTSGESGHHH